MDNIITEDKKIKVPRNYILSFSYGSRWIVRTESRFFDISECPILTNGAISDRDGLILNATEIPDEKVAELVAEAEDRNQQLQSVEALLKEWADIRRARSRRAATKTGKSLTQKGGSIIVKW